MNFEQKNQQAQKSGAEFAAGATAPKSLSIKDLAGAGAGIAFSRVGATDNSKVWADAFEKQVKAADTPHTIIHLDRAHFQLPMSAILVVLNVALEISNNIYVAAHSVVFENPETLGEVMVPAVLQGQGTVPYKPVTSNLYTADWVALVEATVTRQLGDESKGKTVIFIDAGFTQFTTQAAAVQEPTKIDEIAGVRMFHAANAIEEKLSAAGLETKDTTLSLSTLDHNVALRASYFGAPTNYRDVNGIPLRSDAHITVRASERNKQNQSLLNRTDDVDLVRADFYIDTQFAPGADEHAAQGNGFGMAQQPQNKIFKAVVNITNIESLVRRGNSLEYFLLGLTSLGMLHNNLGWATPLYLRGQSTMAGDINLRDIGALGYVAIPMMNPNEAPERFEGTNSPSFPESEFKGLISKLYHTYPSYAIDVVHGNESSWMTNVIAGAADTQNADVRRACEARIREAAATLFGPEFEKEFPTGNVMFISTNNIDPVGYYQSKDGDRPLSDFDYLARLNLWGKTDPEAVEEYARSWVDSNMTPEARVHARLKGPMSKATVVVKDYSEKIVINPNLIAALARCCDKINLNLAAASSELLSYSASNSLINPVWNAFGSGSALQANAFSQTFGGAGRSGGFFSNFNGRF